MNEPKEKGMTLIVKTVTRLTLGFILLYGIYIACYGHVSPGGGFAGGVIVALALVHIMLAFGKDVAMARFKSAFLRAVTGIGALLFLLLISAKPDFLPSFRVIAIPFCEMVVVGCGLFAIFVALVFVSKADKDSE